MRWDNYSRVGLHNKSEAVARKIVRSARKALRIAQLLLTPHFFGHMRMRAMIRKVDARLNEGDPAALRTALDDFFRSASIRDPWTAVLVIRLIRRLLEFDQSDAAIDLVVWLVQQPKATISPNRLTSLSRRLVGSDIAEAFQVRMNSVATPSPIAKALLGLAQINRGAQLSGLELCRSAGLLSGPLHQLSDSESRAACFHRVSESSADPNRAVVLIEPNASPDVVHLIPSSIDNLEICAGPEVSLNDLPIVRAGKAGVHQAQFQLYDIREIAAVRDKFSERFVSFALNSIPELEPLRAHGATEICIQHLRLRMNNALRYLFNYMETIRLTNAQKIFLVIDDGWLLVPLARQLLESDKPPEIWIACGSRNPFFRRAFSDEMAGPKRLRTFTPELARGPLYSNRKRDPIVFQNLSPKASPTPGRKSCVICALAPRGSIAFPLSAVTEKISAEWEPVILLLPNKSSNTLDWLRAELGDRFSEFSIKLLKRQRVSGMDPVDISMAVSSLLKRPEISSLQFRRLDLAPMFRKLCERFVLTLSQVSSMPSVFEDALRYWSPDFVLSQFTYSLENGFLLVSARNQSIPTLAVQTLLHGKDDRLVAPLVDHFLCFDRFAKESLSEMTGFPEDKISIIGSVNYDSVLNRARNLDRQEEREAVGVKGDESLIVVATQPTSLDDNLLLIEIALEAIRDAPKARVVVKLHPREAPSRVSLFEHHVQSWNMQDRAIVTQAHDIYRLLVASDIVVNVHSNVGLEAAILDRKVVAVEIDVASDMFSLGNIGLVDTVCSKQEAVERIQELLLDPEARRRAAARRKAFFSANPELLDGQSMVRLDAIVRNVVKNQRQTSKSIDRIGGATG